MLVWPTLYQKQLKRRLALFVGFRESSSLFLICWFWADGDAGHCGSRREEDKTIRLMARSRIEMGRNYDKIPLQRHTLNDLLPSVKPKLSLLLKSPFRA